MEREGRGDPVREDLHGLLSDSEADPELHGQRADCFAWQYPGDSGAECPGANAKYLGGINGWKADVQR